MKKHLMVEYEDIILDYAYQMRWLLRHRKSIAYNMAVWNSIHEKTVMKLTAAHKRLEALDIKGD